MFTYLFLQINQKIVMFFFFYGKFQKLLSISFIFQGKPLYIILYIIEKKECSSLSPFLYCLLETRKLFNRCVVCYFHYLKTILNNDLFNEYNNQWFLLIYNICYNKKSLLLQLIVFNIYAILKTVYCFNWSHKDLLETDTKRCC